VNPLDDLPLEVLLALQEALADLSEVGRARAAKRAADAGYHVTLTGTVPAGPPPRYDPEPIPMEEAADGVESLLLRFDR
jgi:hypothetical protein